MLFLSAKTGQRVDRVLGLADAVYEQSCRRISTGTLNDVVGEAVMANEPPSDKGRRLRIYYATQAAVQPPTFIVFVNDEALAHFSYRRYLENYLRKSFGLDGTPVRLFFRTRRREEG